MTRRNLLNLLKLIKLTIWPNQLTIIVWVSLAGGFRIIDNVIDIIAHLTSTNLT